jgi:hypothetical protein
VCRYVEQITVEAGLPPLKLEAEGADAWVM